MTRNPSPFKHHPRNGMALVIVLVVVAMLALSAYTFTSLMVAENESAILHGRQLQARQLVDSGVSHVQYFLELDELTRQDYGGVYYNTELFQAQLVQDHAHPRGRGRFAVLGPELDDEGYWGGMRFGLEDESARLNLNALNLEVPDFLAEDLEEGADGPEGEAVEDVIGGLGGDGGSGGPQEEEEEAEEEEAEDEEVDTSGRALLMMLPGMTVDIADAILDWIDEDDNPREYGAEFDFYSGLDPPYSPKNGPLETVEELLLVRGVTPDLLFGRDINRNGMIDMQEQQLPLVVDFDDSDGSLDRGWSSYLTLYSMEKNVNSLGLPRVNLNIEDMQQLYDELSAVVDPAWATFIVAYRQNGPIRENNDEDDEEQEQEDQGGGPQQPGGGRGGGGGGGSGGDEDELKTEPAGNQPLDLTQPGRVPVGQVLDLIGVNVRVRLEGEEEDIIIESPFPEEMVTMASYLPELMDNCTVNPEPIIPGRVNINRAPRAVLMAIPGMDENLVDLIISQRDLEDGELNQDFNHETWLLTRAIVTLDEMRELMPYVTAGGDVYRAQIVGYFDEGEISARSEVIFDATSASPRILFWRDISHLGRGFPAELLGVDRSTPE